MMRLLLLSALAGACGDKRDEEPVEQQAQLVEISDFDKRINPILANHCGGCHSSGGKYVQFVGNEAVVRALGDEIARRITSTDPKVVMPPPRYHAAMSQELQSTVLTFLGK